MTRKKRNSDLVISKNYTKKKLIDSSYLISIDPITVNQKKLFDSYKNQKNIVAHGYPGTGKTFITLYNSLKEVLDERTPYEKVYIVRSIVSTRDVGYLPGGLEEKIEIFESPYKNMVKYMFQMPSEVDFDMLYGNLKSQKTLEFMSTSFLRGTTLDNCIIIVDEFQNANFHELDSIITRVGENCKIMFCGDASQSDLIKSNERNGIIDFMKILKTMSSFDIIEFEVDDIVRSGLVRDYIIAKKSLGL
jgi:predicted ribonuclease YlaK